MSGWLTGWATREEFARERGPEVLAAEAELAACMDYGREHLAEVADDGKSAEAGIEDGERCVVHAVVLDAGLVMGCVS